MFCYCHRKNTITVLATLKIEFLSVPIEIYYELIKSTNKVNIAIDGGTIPYKGSLGFVFADEDGNIYSAIMLWHGQPSGNDSTII